MSFGDLAQVLLGGAASGLNSAGDTLEKEKEHKRAVELAKSKKQDDLMKVILSSLAGSAGQEMAKSGMYPDMGSFGDVMAQEDMQGYGTPMKFIQALFGRQGDYLPGREPNYLPNTNSGGGGGGGLPKPRVFQPNPNGGWSDPMGPSGAAPQPMIQPQQKKTVTPDAIQQFLNR